MFIKLTVRHQKDGGWRMEDEGGSEEEGIGLNILPNTLPFREH